MNKCIILVFVTGFGTIATPLSAQQYQYAGLFGENAYDIQVVKQQENSKPVLILEEKERYSKHTFHPKLGTEKWVLRDKKEKHNFTAQRTDNQIKIWGTFQGESVEKTVDIDERLWFNKLDHGLSEFAASDQQELSFWVLKLVSDLDPLKMEAKKVGTESLTIDGKTYESVKVKLTIDNFVLSKLWSAELWYRASDGLFLRYEGANGGPGTPTTIIELDKKIEG
ncbi:MAG: hypothetical protein WBA23_06890 [Tunicatimonas sp.]|uniref:hypothetical protein n=1 Tax=Tunicatimonas sp. TaxID=1940096 RepID=UPI003C72680C